MYYIYIHTCIGCGSVWRNVMRKVEKGMSDKAAAIVGSLAVGPGDTIGINPRDPIFTKEETVVY